MANDGKFGGMVKWAEYTLLLIIIAFTGVLLPAFSYLTLVLMPLPVMFIIIRYDLKYGLISLVSAVLVLLFSFQQFRPELALDPIQYGLIGIVLGLFFKKAEPPGRVLVFTVLIAVGLAVMASGAAYLHNGENPLVLSEDERQALTQQWSAMNQQMRLMEEEELATVAPGGETESFRYLTEVYQYYLPAQMIVTAAVTAAFTFILAIFLLGRYGFKVQPGLAFSEIYLPWYSIWGLIVGLGLLLLGDNFNEIIAKAGKNMLFILVNLYFIMGLSVFVHFFKTIKLSPLLKGIIVVAMFCFYPFSCIFLLTIGAIDPLINFRRITALK